MGLNLDEHAPGAKSFMLFIISVITPLTTKNGIYKYLVPLERALKVQ